MMDDMRAAMNSANDTGSHTSEPDDILDDLNNNNKKMA